MDLAIEVWYFTHEIKQLDIYAVQKISYISVYKELINADN